MDKPSIHQLIQSHYNRTANSEFIAMVDRILAKHTRNLSHKPLRRQA